MPECRAAILLHHLVQSPNTSEVERMQLTDLYSTYEEMANDFRKGSSVGNVGPIVMSNEIANRITRHTEAMASESKVLNPYFAQVSLEAHVVGAPSTHITQSDRKQRTRDSAFCHDG